MLISEIFLDYLSWYHYIGILR